MPTCCALVHVKELNYIWIKLHQECSLEAHLSNQHCADLAGPVVSVGLEYYSCIHRLNPISWKISTWISILQDGMPPVQDITAIAKNWDMNILHGNGCILCICHAQNLRTAKVGRDLWRASSPLSYPQLHITYVLSLFQLRKPWFQAVGGL